MLLDFFTAIMEIVIRQRTGSTRQCAYPVVQKTPLFLSSRPQSFFSAVDYSINSNSYLSWDELLRPRIAGPPMIHSDCTGVATQ